MRFQNRVDPWGRLSAVPGRDTTRMGNRGRLHDEHQRLVRQFKGKRWITCQLAVNGEEPRKGKVWGDSYSELFFLDDATALSAGHRPCAYCNREAYDAFCAAWRAANPDALPADSRSVAGIDAHLHRERLNPDRTKRTYPAALASLPRGTIVELDGHAYLLWKGRLCRWSFTGYTENLEIEAAPAEVTVLTPHSVVKMLAAGRYSADVHPTANAA